MDINATPSSALLTADDTPQSILIVDDQRSSVEMLAGIVSTLPGAPRIKSFNDPLQALAYIQSRQQDLILLDHHMPGMTGLAFLKTIRAFPTYRTVPVVMVTTETNHELCREALEAGATDFLKKPFDPDECKARCTNLLAARRDRQEVEQYRQAAENELKQSVELHRNRATTTLKECMFWTATAIDHYAGKIHAGHIFRIGHYAGLIAQQMGYTDADVIDIVAAANTHDIGNIAIPIEILHKDTLLTGEERLIVEQHCVDGATMLRSFPHDIAELAAQVAESHHEHIDGSGYPRGLKGDDIPIVARIVRVADVFDALTTPNAIRKAMPIAAAYQHLISLRDIEFDGDCVDALMKKDDAIQHIVPTSLKARQ